jgi:hypothetical protein
VLKREVPVFDALIPGRAEKNPPEPHIDRESL